MTLFKLSRVAAIAVAVTIGFASTQSLRAQTCPSHGGCTGKQCTPEMMEKAKGMFQKWQDMTPEEKVTAAAEHLKTAFNLNEDQMTKVNFILNDSKAEMKQDWDALKAAPKGDAKTAAAKKMRMDFEAMHQKFAAVLNDEQRAQLNGMLEGRNERWGHAMHQWKAGQLDGTTPKPLEETK